MDYVSFIGFFTYYVGSLCATTSSDSSRTDSGATLSPIPSNQITAYDTLDTISPQGISLVIGGYSYGSLIVTLLPDTESILNRFTNVTVGSAEAEVRLRALHLSTQWNRDALLRGRLQQDKSLRIQENSMVMGGEESDPGSRRPSRDSRKSVDTIRRSVDFSKRRLGLRHSNSGEAEALPLESDLLPAKVTVTNSYYLLISPLRPPISSFMTMFFRARHPGHELRSSSLNLQGHRVLGTDNYLVSHPTLVVYGDKDFFTSQKKLRKWVEDLAGRPRSSFRFREIAGAGHFWQEEGVEVQLRTSIRDWIKDISSREDIQNI